MVGALKSYARPAAGATEETQLESAEAQAPRGTRSVRRTSTLFMCSIQAGQQKNKSSGKLSGVRGVKTKRTPDVGVVGQVMDKSEKPS